MLEPRIIEVKHFDSVEFDVEDMHEVTEISLKMVNNAPYAVLIVPGKFTSYSKEAKQLGASTELPGERLATALVTPSLSEKLIGNFYLRFNKPTSPTKMFENREAALQWLRQVMDKTEARN